MKLIELAKEFADMNIFNSYTRSAVITAAKLFVERTNIELIGEVTLRSVGTFKQRTLEVAKPVSYNGYLKYLRILGDYAVSQQLISENMFRKVKLATVGKLPCKVIEGQDITDIENYLLEHQTTHRPYWFWLTVINCLYFTGMRRRQLVHLRIGDLDFQNSVIRLRYEGSKTLREWKIPMHDELATHLSNLILQIELATNQRLYATDYVFQIHRLNKRYKVSKKGTMEPASITGFFKRLSSKSGIRVGAHRFRHTLATNLCNPEGDIPPDIFAAQEILGHTNLQTTRGYVNTNIKRMNKALCRITKPDPAASKLLDNPSTLV